MVSFQESNLFTLDSMNGVVVGVAVFNDSIKSISTSGGFLYILSNAVTKSPVIRIAVHYSYVTTEWKPLLSTPSTSVNNSPMGSLESLTSGKTTGAPQFEKPDFVHSQQAAEQSAHSIVPCMHETSSADPSQDSMMPHFSHEEQIPDQFNSAQPPPPVLESFNDDLKTRDIEEIGPVLYSDVGSTKGASVDYVVRMEADRPDLLEPTLLLSVPQRSSPARAVPEEQEVLDEWDITVTQFDETNEQSRRLQMSQASGEDIVADKSHRKRKKKVKGNKLSSATSKYMYSL